MKTTPKDLILKQNARHNCVRIAVLLATIVFAFAAALIGQQVVHFWIWMWLLSILACGVAIHGFPLRCPQCRAKFDFHPGRRGIKRLNYCQFCGISLNEPTPSPNSKQQKQCVAASLNDRVSLRHSK